MSIYDVKRLALVFSIQAEIEGMKAENVVCEFEKRKPTYSKLAFNNIAEELRNLAYKNDYEL